MKRRLRIVIILFGVSFAFMAGLSLFALNQFSSLVKYSDRVDRAHKVINEIYKIELLIKDLDVNERGFMITSDSGYLQNLFVINTRILPETETLKAYLTDDRHQRRLLTHLRVILIQRRDNMRKNLHVFSGTREEISPFFFQGIENREAAMNALYLLKKHEDQKLREVFQTKMHYQESTYDIIRYLLSFFAVITIVLFLILMRELRRRMIFQDELQMKMADLKHSHAELEQIAHAVSHDLQEPLRKIRVFANRLLVVKKGQMDEDSQLSLSRINDSAARMDGLIADLMNLTSLVREESTQRIDLNTALQTVLGELHEKVREKNATIQTETLAEIYGHPGQIQLLLKSLIDNALKFSLASRSPVISVRGDRVNGEELQQQNIQKDQLFYRLTIADNGIGFEDKFIRKMFQMFQSLHNRESGYSGQGVGLALCQRIMVNHGGYILAHGKPGIGATFRLYFPLRN